MQEPITCLYCGVAIDLQAASFCNDCRDQRGMCRECWVDHAEWHDAKDNQPDDETGHGPLRHARD